MAGKRSIFEEVGQGAQSAPPPQGGMIAAKAQGARRGIRLWLVALFLLVATMIAVGGMTRLTDSGLSITEWRPVTGAIPPMDEATWAAEFDKYRAIPEYQLQNKGMSLEDFKVDLLVGMGPSAVGPGDRTGLGGGVPGFSGRAADPAGLERAAAGAGRAGRIAGCDWLVDGEFRPDGDDAGRGVLSFGDASGAGLCDPWVDCLVCVPAGPD